MRHKVFITVSGFLSVLSCLAQDTTKNNQLSFSGFMDVYYQYDFDNPASRLRPAFLYNYKKHNEFNVNLGLIKAAYTNKKIRANIALMIGNYAQFNLAAEPAIAQNIYEANVGYDISKKVSIDAGIMPSHIGLESAISKDNWNLGRSILAENTPYYETGIKLTYHPNGKFTTAFLILNGWQNIQETNSNKAIGTQVQYKPTAKWLFNSSTFIGNEKPDSARQLRLFHNFYATYVISKKMNAALLFDIGAEKQINSAHYNTWFGTALLLQYSINSKYSSSFRVEHYNDRKGVIVSANTANGFQTFGYSLNLDYKPVENILFRTEARLFNARDDIFLKNGALKNNNYSMLASLAIWF